MLGQLNVKSVIVCVFGSSDYKTWNIHLPSPPPRPPKKKEKEKEKSNT
jgi:hypothetical protein